MVLLSYNSILGLPVDESTNNSDENNKIDINPRLIIILAVVVGLFIILFSSIGNKSKNSSSLSLDSISKSPSSSNKNTKTLEIILGGVVIVVLIVSGIQYFFNINLTARLQNLFTGEPQLDIISQNIEPGTDAVPPVPEIQLKKQVFHIPGNKYTYPNAEALCDAYGARLANYNEVEEAYNNGAEWCSYGWTDNQMALFPTQKKNMGLFARCRRT